MMSNHVSIIRGVQIGDLPVGLRGKFFGMSFEVLMQYDIEGKVGANVFGDSGHITNITGDKRAEPIAIDDILRAYYKYELAKGNDLQRASDSEKQKKFYLKHFTPFVKNISTEVRDFNSGKNTQIKDVSKTKFIKRTSEHKFIPNAYPSLSPQAPVLLKKAISKKTKKLKRHKPMGKKKNSPLNVVRYSSKTGQGKSSKYSIKRDSSGQFKRFDRIAGLGVLGSPDMYTKRDYLEKELQSALEQYSILVHKKKNRELPLDFRGLFKKYPRYISSLKKQIREQNKHISSLLK